MSVGMGGWEYSGSPGAVAEGGATPDSMRMPTLTMDQIADAAAALFAAAGTSSEDARTVAGLLAEANCAGHDSHGLIRVPQYLAAIEDGRIDPAAEVEVARETSITAVLDGHWGFGQVAMTRAVELASEKASTHGLAAVTVRGASHIGRLGSYVERLARRDLAALLLVNAVGIPAYRMAPWGGTEARLATDPLAFGAPRSDGDPVVLDMTTTVVAEGKVRVQSNRGEPVPEGWLIDAEGRPTTDPNVLYGEPRGSILPLGGSAAGHKGYGLNVALELLAGALSGTGCIGGGQPLGNGVLLIALDVERFLPLDEFHRHAERFFAHVKSSPPAAGFDGILLPGEIEGQVQRRRQKEGISVDDETWRQVRQWADKLGVDLPLPEESR